MATKATAGRKAVVAFAVSGSTTTATFSAVRNWTLRAERQVIDATNNDSAAWRELVLPSTAAGGRSDAGQLSVVMRAEAVYDLNPLGPGGVAGRSQPYERKQLMRHLVDGQPLTHLSLRLGSDPASTSSYPQPGYWAALTGQGSPSGFVESVEIGGSYDEPVLYDVTFRFTRRNGQI